MTKLIGTTPKYPDTPLHPIFDHVIFREFETLISKFSPVGNSVFFSVEQFPWAKELEANWQVIRQEFAQLLLFADSLPSFQDISPKQRRVANDNGWKTYFFYALGYKSIRNCQRCPETWNLLQKVPGLKIAFFSILAPGKHIPEHRGKHKGVIRYHLALKVPEPKTACRIRIGEQIAYWQEGKSLIFDDTFFHEVWNETDDYRAVLFLDIARPLYFPFSMVNWLVFQAMANSPFMRFAKTNHKLWEKQFEIFMQAQKYQE